MEGKFEITEEIENDDGSLTLVFDVDDEFKSWFKDLQGLKRWSDKRFEKWVVQAITAKLEHEKAVEEIRKSLKIDEQKYWGDILRERYPALLRDIPFECGPGWATLLDTLCHQIQQYEKFNVPGPYMRTRFSQIKEKFGTLRAYHNGDDFVEGLVQMAEAVSDHTCEDCGNKAKMRRRGQHGWMYTRCDPCWEDTQKKIYGGLENG